MARKLRAEAEPRVAALEWSRSPMSTDRARPGCGVETTIAVMSLVTDAIGVTASAPLAKSPASPRVEHQNVGRGELELGARGGNGC